MNSLLSPMEILPIALENKYLGILSIFLIKMVKIIIIVEPR